MCKNGELTPKQQRTIIALLSSRNLGAACKQAGVSRTTLSRWLEDPTFKEALSKARGEAIRETTIALIGCREMALEVLQNLMSNGTSESIRRQTAIDWLNMLLRFNDLSDIEARITRLEAEQQERNKAKSTKTAEIIENCDDSY